MNESTKIPRLYTKGEVIRMLRIDSKNTEPLNSLNYLIRTDQLRPIKICGENMFTEESIRDYLTLCQEKSG